LHYQANWEQVVMWVDYKPVDVKIDDDNSGIFCGKFLCYVPVYSKTVHLPPTQTLGYLTSLKNFGQISRYIACLDSQMPHPLELQRGSNLPTSRHV